MNLLQQSNIFTGFTNIPSIDEETIKKDLLANLSSCGEIISIFVRVPHAVVVFSKKNNSKSKICEALPLGPLGMFVGTNEIERINL